ncbi:MAG TPA: 23S rRNA (pseudouridine(1915)-N(3))-methyltransferase RlmH [Nitrospirota bacterium]|jgi:23S rRNA (pseudouridine1915-N3)-methyltransferase
MGLLFLFVGKTKEGFVREGLDKYEKLAGHFVKLEVRELKGSSASDRQTAIEEEADAMLDRVGPGDILVALDERGNNPTSVEFAGELSKFIESGKTVVFAIGGPFGISDRIKARAQLVLSLSRLTFTHEMARLVLMEQAYRALTIIKGRTYHY